MGWIGCVHCKKFRRDFVARTFAPLRPFCTEFCNSTKRSPMHQNCTKHTEHEFRVQWGGSGAFVAKNSDATSRHEHLHHYDRFAPSFVTQPNGPKCTKIVRMHKNISLGSNGVDRVRSLRKIPTRLRGTNFFTITTVLHRVL